MKFSALLLLAALQLALAGGAASGIHPGIIIRAEDRFDPAIQRLMAERSLRLLPLRRGQLYYLYPIGEVPRFEGVQIRYLEQLLDKQAQREATATPEEDATGSPITEEQPPD